MNAAAPRIRFEAAAWFACYAALAVAVTYPLVRHLGSTVAHDLGDPLLSTSLLWWNAHTIPLTNTWWNGFSFFPVTGSLAFSDHRLGASLLATPLQWLGASPVTAYNVTLMATFPLCALAAHWLAFLLTGRRDAALICGLSFGFSPYRVAHIEHLELLAAFGVPMALAAAHQYLDTRRVKWLAVFGSALVLQALSASYYALFFSVLFLLWLAWFARGPGRGAILPLAATCAAAAVVVSPLVAGYMRIHQQFGLSRNMVEIRTYSADLTSFVTASGLSTLWGWTSELNGPERQLFPGLTVLVLATAGAVHAIRRRRSAADRLDWWSRLLFAAAVALALLGIGQQWSGAPRIDLGWISLSGRGLYKTMSIALVALVGAVATSSHTRAAVRARSTLAFYLLTSGVFALCSLGPLPTFLGQRVLYLPPYAWLMRLPVFDTGVRAPARFWMLTVLTLAVAAAVAFSRLEVSTIRRRIAATLVAFAIVADGWITGLPLPTLPDMWPVARAAGFSRVIELPIGELMMDATAVYRAIQHGRPVVNGMSGYDPRHYRVVRLAAQEGDFSFLDALTSEGRSLVVLDSRFDGGGQWRAALDANPRVSPIGADGNWSFFALEGAPAPQLCDAPVLPFKSAFDRRGPVSASLLTDGRATYWLSGKSQRTSEMLVIDLGKISSVCAVSLSLGDGLEMFPRVLDVATSADGTRWDSGWHASGSSPAIRGALARPTDVWMDLPLGAPAPARFIRLRSDTANTPYGWMVTDVVVRGWAIPPTSGTPVR
jgi:hypothetical protein